MNTSMGAIPTSKEVYVRALETKLSLKKAQLLALKQKVRHATEAGRIGPSEQLRNAEKRADSALAMVEAKLQQLDDASDGLWESLKPESDVAWEDLSRSLKAIVNRFS